jgi:uncharacterized protein YciI
MRFAVIFAEGAEMEQVRAVAEPAHLAFLETYRDEIPMAGGLRNEHGGSYVGGLWVFEVESRERAIALIERDPYFLANSRRYRLLAWGKALPQYRPVM